jgi:hypothetical protein
MAREHLSTGLFRDRDSAERAYNDLVARGYRPEDVNIVMTEEARRRHFSERKPTTPLGTKATEVGSKALEGAGVGGGIGAVAGGALAALAAAATVALPGVGLIVAGPIAAGLAGAGAGAVTGGAIGALVGAGIPEERVKEYEPGLREGGIVMGVKPRNTEEAQYFEREWHRDTIDDPAGRPWPRS